MAYIAARQPVVTGTASDGEPSDAELFAVEREMPVVLAEVELLDAQIMTLDRIPTEVDARQLRRARRRVLAARRALANGPAGRTGGAA